MTGIGEVRGPVPEGFPADPAEFSFLEQEAAEWGIAGPIPSVRRLTGDRVSALRWGTGPIQYVLLHGVGLNAHTFDATVMALAAHHPVSALAIDLPGHGDSGWNERADYTPQALAGPVTALMREHLEGRVVLVGQSLGGLTALLIAAADAALVARLVVIDISPGFDPTAGAAVSDFLSGPTDFASRAEIVERAAAFGFGAGRAALERGVALNTRVRTDGRVVFKHHLANLGDVVPPRTDFASLWPAARSLTMPVHLIRATGGFLSDGVVDEFLGSVLQSQASTVVSGHNVQEQAPVELASLIDQR